MNILVNKLKRNGKLKKKAGDDKLVISLVLIAVGVVLCFLYRTQITAVVTNAIDSLGDKIEAMFGGATAISIPFLKKN